MNDDQDRNKAQAEAFKSLYGSSTADRETGMPASLGAPYVNKQAYANEAVESLAASVDEVHKRHLRTSMFGIRYGTDGAGFRRGEMATLGVPSSGGRRKSDIGAFINANAQITATEELVKKINDLREPKPLRGYNKLFTHIDDLPFIIQDEDHCAPWPAAQIEAFNLAIEGQRRSLIEGGAIYDLASRAFVDSDAATTHKPSPTMRIMIDSYVPPIHQLGSRVGSAITNDLAANTLEMIQSVGRAGREVVPVEILTQWEPPKRVVDPKTTVDLIAQEKAEAAAKYERAGSTIKPNGNNKARAARATKKLKAKMIAASRKRNR